MTRQVVFRPEAEGEVLEAREWYETKRSGLGKEFAQAVDEMVDHIVENPLAYQRAYKETRRPCTTGSPVRTSLFRPYTGDNISLVGNRADSNKIDTRSNSACTRRRRRGRSAAGDAQPLGRNTSRTAWYFFKGVRPLNGQRNRSNIFTGTARMPSGSETLRRKVQT